ncbi:hypothetical protein ACFQ3P_41335 [Paraburkholderia sabiae]|uniref:Uncharacterized protein n=1 Tax=Paraburkholderia sabiae TaxID=273251 RepID=A0ABU9QRJ6_9BURK|nr:hypothetical protein [Paraburkholderia sabiae]WJZ79527.1 hypothetical protein QEN71_40155 [Paraburkholderia sabiae]CAD6562971.1 hypothetical protein LMG24235_08213 [Paraburkholderia sabiae]
MSSQKMPVLGIVKLDRPEIAGSKSSPDLCEPEGMMPFSVDDPTMWQQPLQKVVAEGTGGGGLDGPTEDAVRGILEAAQRLDGRSQLIIGNCGYMWSARGHLYRKLSTPVVTSALEFVDLALKITTAPVGIITWNAATLKPLMHGVNELERLRFLTVRDLPDWANWPQDPFASATPRRWTKERMAQQLQQRVADAFREGGNFEQVGIIVIECTLVPDFRDAIRAVTSVPIIDLLSFAKAALD